MRTPTTGYNYHETHFDNTAFKIISLKTVRTFKSFTTWLMSSLEK